MTVTAIVATGGMAFVGGHLAEVLLTKGNTVTVIGDLRRWGCARQAAVGDIFNLGAPHEIVIGELGATDPDGCGRGICVGLRSVHVRSLCRGVRRQLRRPSAPCPRYVDIDHYPLCGLDRIIEAVIASHR